MSLSRKARRRRSSSQIPILTLILVALVLAGWWGITYLRPHGNGDVGVAPGIGEDPKIPAPGHDSGSKSLFSSADTWTSAGMPIISDPSSNIAFQATGADSLQKAFFGSISTKAGSVSTGRNLLATSTDIAYYPFIFNRVGAGVICEAGFRVVDGVPTGIWDFSIERGTAGPRFKGSLFTWEDVAVMVVETEGTDGIRAGCGIADGAGNAHNTGSIVDLDGQKVIKVRQNDCGYWFAMTCTDMDGYRLQPDRVDITLSLGRNAGDTVTDADAHCACGDDFDGRGLTVFAFAIGADGDATVTRATAAISDWHTLMQKAEDYWCETLNPVARRWDKLPSALKRAGLLATQQVISSTWDGFVSPGVPDWPHNFLRDTSMTVLAMASTLPSQASEWLEWFSDADDLRERNQYLSNKKAVPMSYFNSDNAPSFLLACASVYEQTSDLTLMKNLKTQMDRALIYCQTNYVPDDGHVTALHPHDYWDDYFGITVAEVKYESLIDVLWLAALERVGPIYEILGDSLRCSFCSTTANGIAAKLVDFRLADGSLLYAYRKDGSEFPGVYALPGTLYSAWLRDDRDAAAFLQQSSGRFGPVGIRQPFGLQHSTFGPPPDHGWGPYAAQQCYIAAKYYANVEPTLWLAEQFKVGGFPEYVQADSETGRLTWKSHAASFTWSNAMMVHLMDYIAQGMH